MKRAFIGLVLSLALAFSARAGAQDRSAKTFTVVVGHVVHLQWTASTTPMVNYNIYVASVSGGPYTLVSSTSLLAFADLDATAGHTYYYVVTAVDSMGDESVYSNEADAVIPTP